MPNIVVLIDAVLIFTVLEGVALLLYHRRSGRGVAPRDFVANLVAGLCLMAALRVMAHELGSPWVLLVLLGLIAAGVAHAIDIVLRWRGETPPAPVVRKGIA